MAPLTTNPTLMKMNTFCGTPAYFAPEIITTHKHNGEGCAAPRDL